MSSHVEFYRQLACLIQSGMPLPDALRSMQGVLGKPAFQTALEEISERLEAGSTLSQELQRQPRFFPEAHVDYVRKAESLSSLDLSLRQLADYAAFDQSLLCRFRSVMFYPLLVITITAALFIGFAVFLAPQSTELINDISLEVGVSSATQPLTYRFILWSAENAAILSGIVALFVLLASTLLLQSRKLVQRGWMKVAGLGSSLLRDYDNARLCSSLAMQLSNGGDLGSGMKTAAQLIGGQYGGDLSKAAERLEAGSQPSSVFDTLNVDPMLKITVRKCPQAKLAEELDELAKHFRERLENAARRLEILWRLIAVGCSGLLVFITFDAVLTPLKLMMDYFTR